MNKYSCPICGENNSPVALHAPRDGEIVLATDSGLLIERKQCSGCGERIERKPLDHWYPTARLVPNGDEPAVELAYH